MRTSIKLRLNTARCTRDEMYPLVFQVLRGGRKRVISLGVSLRKEWFDKTAEQVMRLPSGCGGLKRMREINSRIRTIRTVLENIVQELATKYPDYGVEAVSERYRRRQDLHCFFTFVEQEKRQLEVTGRYNTAGQYESLRNSVARYCVYAGWPERLLLNQITSAFIVDYKKYLERTGLKKSSVSTYLSLLRAVYNRARRIGIVTGDETVFHGSIPRGAPTEKRAVKAGIIRKLMQAELASFPSLARTRDVFMISLYLEGMALRDIMNLKRTDIRNGVITYRRSKTGSILRVRIVPELQELIDKYRTDDSYLFPFLLSDKKHDHKNYKSVLRRINRHLHKLEVLLDIPFHLTMYVARHSWASLAQECDVPIEKISQALGHTSTKTTQIYLKGFNYHVIDEVNRRVIDNFRKEQGKAGLSC